MSVTGERLAKCNNLGRFSHFIDEIKSQETDSFGEAAKINALGTGAVYEVTVKHMSRVLQNTVTSNLYVI